MRGRNAIMYDCAMVGIILEAPRAHHNPNGETT